MKDQITIALERELIADIDRWIDSRKIKNRASAIEILLNRALERNRPGSAVLLLGGRGTRFRPLTYELPKALFPVQGKTVPEHLIELFGKFRIPNLIFSVGYKADKIKEYYGNGSRFGVNITYIEETEPAGSAGAIKLAAGLLNRPFVVTNGDELKDIDLEEMYLFHKKNKALVTVALTTVSDPTPYGVARLEGARIAEFVEKPSKEEAPSNLINSGLSIWEPEAIRFIPNGFSMYEKDVFPALAHNKMLFGFPFSGQWFDTGTPERYEKARLEWRGIQ